MSVPFTAPSVFDFVQRGQCLNRRPFVVAIRAPVWTLTATTKGPLVRGHLKSVYLSKCVRVPPRSRTHAKRYNIDIPSELNCPSRKTTSSVQMAHVSLICAGIIHKNPNPSSVQMAHESLICVLRTTVCDSLDACVIFVVNLINCCLLCPAPCGSLQRCQNLTGT